MSRSYDEDRYSYGHSKERERERGTIHVRRKRRRESHKLTTTETATAEDALDDFFGGTATVHDTIRFDNISHPIQGGYNASNLWSDDDSDDGRYSSRPTGASSQYPTAGVKWSSSIGADITDPIHRVKTSRDHDCLREPPDGKYDADWERAAHRAGENGQFVVRPCLVMTRRGHRYRSCSFHYQQGCTDQQLAAKIKYQYANLKMQDVGFLQKLVAYRTIAYVMVLRACCKPHGKGYKWVVTKRVPITSRSDKEGRDTFMYLLRYTPSGRRWTRTIDELLEEGAILYFEIVETFDASKVYLAMFLTLLLSLAAALAYGFAMDNDFATGFSIAGWMVTASGFFAALVSITEQLGLEKVTSWQTGTGIEEESDVPRELRVPSKRRRSSFN